MSNAVPSDLPDGAIKLNFKDPKVDYFTSLLNLSSTFPSHDSYVGINSPSQGMGQIASAMRRFGETIGMSDGHRQSEPYVVLDSGISSDMVGGIGWKIIQVTSDKQLLIGAIEGMGTYVLPRVDASLQSLIEVGKLYYSAWAILLGTREKPNMNLSETHTTYEKIK